MATINLFKKVLAFLLITMWGIPWIILPITIFYGNYALATNPEDTQFLGILLLGTTFMTLLLSGVSTAIFSLFLAFSPNVAQSEKGAWLRRFAFSYITAIPKFWYGVIWSSK